MSDRRLHSVAPLKADPTEVARLRALADDALHTYICAATGYDLARAMVIYNRVRTTLDGQLHPRGGAAA
jgi:hypothetical protein